MKYEKVTTHQQATQVVLKMRTDSTIYVNDSELAKKLGLAKLTLYKRLAFSDWKPLEIAKLNEVIANILNTEIDSIIARIKNKQNKK